MSEAFHGEVIVRSLEELLQENLGAALDEVAAFWLEIEPVALTDVPAEGYYIGHKPSLISRPSSDFPMIALIAPGRSPNGARSRTFQSERYRVYIDIFNVADDEETVNMMTWRYIEAVTKVVQSVATIEGYSIGDYKPEVNISEAGRHMKDQDAADMSFQEDEDFAPIGRVTIVLTD